MLEIGLKHTSELTVSEALTAIQMGSGDMPVLATPAMMALMENAAMLAVADELPEGCTTVGGHIESSHLRPSKIGDIVSATAEVTKVDGKKIEFKVSAYSGDTLLGEGTHLRFIVDKERFMSNLDKCLNMIPEFKKTEKTMKLKKRKIKYSAIFFICWFALLVILVDGILKFQTLVDYFGSYALVEITLLLLVILPTLAVYRYTND